MRAVRRDKAHAEALITGHPAFSRLKENYRTLDPVERAEIVSEICSKGNRMVRPLARALGRDPKSIQNDLRVARMNAAQKADIRSGKSINGVLREANQKDDKPATPEEWVIALQAEIIQLVGDLDVGPGHAEDILDSVIDKLERMNNCGVLQGRRRSRMTPYYLLRYTKPKREPDRTDHNQWFPAWTKWLLRYAIRREPEYEILDLALRQARNYVIAQPPVLRPWGAAAREAEDRTRDQVNEMRKIQMLGVDGMRDPRSIPNPEEYAKQRERELQREKEEANAEYQRRLEQLCALLAGLIEPIRGKPAKLTTIAEDREQEEKKKHARSEARAEYICTEMGWARPKSTAFREPDGKDKEVPTP